MCKLCNESLLAAAHAAAMLASAAKDLYNINQSAEASTLAKAAAELFTVAKEERRTGDVSPNQSKPAEDAAQPGQTRESANPQPKGFDIDDEGIVRINGVALGRVVVISKPTQH